MLKKITDKVSWVGKTDWELTKFHGDEYSTHKGSSYNAYLVRDQKTVLIDTVWQPFDKSFVQSLKQEIDLSEIDYIVVNHSEVDHSGALCELMREIPDTPIYCTNNGMKILKGMYHQDWNYVTVKTGDTLDLGENKLIFIESAMLHWPDNMMCYLTGENILFSNDAFGQHFAGEGLYTDLVDQSELYTEAMKYYANILTPFSTFAVKKIQEILSMNLPIDIIAPSHGLIWRDNPAQIVTEYLKWANDYQENQITIVYDTMWNSTRMMAESIADGIRLADPDVTVKILNAAKYDKNDILLEVFRSKAVLMGSSTINNGFLTAIAVQLEMIKGMRFKKKKAAAFGSYGWSGEAVKQITKHLTECGFEIVNDGLRLMWVPDREALQTCVEFGKSFVQAL